jgi:hypothetical protein
VHHGHHPGDLLLSQERSQGLRRQGATLLVLMDGDRQEQLEDIHGLLLIL